MDKFKKIFNKLIFVGFILAVLAGIIVVLLQLFGVALGLPQFTVDVSDKLLGPIVIFGNTMGFFCYVSNSFNKKDSKSN